MEKKLIMDDLAIQRSLKRITHEIIEHNKGVDNIILVGIRSRGVYLARRLAALIRSFEQVEIPVYALEKAGGRDPYALFLSGSKSLLTIENPRATTDRALILFRDSFGSSLAPLLVDGYAKITLVDIRYISPALLDRFIAFDDQDVLFLYSVSILNSSETIK